MCFWKNFIQLKMVPELHVVLRHALKQNMFYLVLNYELGHSSDISAGETYTNLAFLI